jgi:transposase-like protein
MNKCSNHRQYKGEKFPRWDCPECRKVFDEIHKKKIKENLNNLDIKAFADRMGLTDLLDPH